MTKNIEAMKKAAGPFIQHAVVKTQEDAFDVAVDIRNLLEIMARRTDTPVYDNRYERSFKPPE